MSSSIPETVARVRAYFTTHVTKSYDWRLRQLRGLKSMLVENEEAFVAAVHADLGRARHETMTGEVLLCQAELDEGCHRLKQWMAPEHVTSPITLMPASSYMQYEPYGLILVIAPFNYPVQLTVLPLYSAFAAGNVAVLKPSELTPATSSLFARLLPQYVDPQAIAVVEGAVPETTALLKERWDYIFFTGSENVGKIVMRAAAENLTPVILELGGKSPVIVCDDADLKLAARRVMWGKLMNAGQTCTAPDHVFVHATLKQKFIDECKSAIQSFYPATPAKSADYGRIINEHHTERLKKIIESHRADIVTGGEVDVSNKYVSPTLIDIADVDNAAVMKEEIFGPLLPFLSFTDLNTVIASINQRPKPLALYVFTSREAVKQQFLTQTSSGAVVFNDVVMQSTNSALPFGGVGTSGMGAYHGKHGFVALSHAKPIIDKSLYLDAPQRYPPYNEANLKALRYLMSLTRINQETLKGAFKFILLPIALAVIAHKLGLIQSLKARL